MAAIISVYPLFRMTQGISLHYAAAQIYQAERVYAGYRKTLN
jgi:hypothetical protein